MATRHDARRNTGRVAALAAGVLMLGSVWGGIASAADDPTTTTPPPAANAAAAAPASTPCATFTAQLAQATAALQAANGLDPTGTLAGAVTTLTGQVATACAAVPALPAGSTTTTTAAPLAAVAGAPAVAGAADRDCPSFTSQAEAQAYFTAIGGSAARNADLLDRDRDGLACEDTPYAAASPVLGYPAGTFGQVATVPSGGIETGDGSTAP